ncbi:hypothetical protein ACB098_04G053000 [Castanea mollissima]
MAEGEEVQKQAQETLARVEEEVVVTDVPQAEKAAATTVEKVPPPVPDTEEPTKPKPIKEEPEEGAAEAEVSKSGDNINDEKSIPLSGSFKEESTRVSDLPETEKKALEELKQLIQEALNKHEFTTLPSPPPPPPPPPKEDQEKPEALEEKDKNPVEEKPSQVVADDETANPESETVAEPEKIAEPAIEGETVEVTETVVVTEVIEEKVAFMHGFDRDGHPVCYNVYGEFQNKELYQKAFSDEEKRLRFLRWRIQFLERSIRKLDFKPGGISTLVQVNDLKNSPGPNKWELRQATKQALQLLQDNYPEFVAKQVFINVPWWYLAVNRMISPFLTQRTKSKFVFAGPSKSAETLLRYITAEQVPVKYGGLSKDGEFGTTDAVTEVTVRPAAKHTVEFPVTESCLLTWEVRVVGWDVSYGAEFVPSAEESYTVIIQKARKVASSEEPVVCNSFKIGEPGKVVLTIDNATSKKKKLLYRLKTKASSD